MRLAMVTHNVVKGDGQGRVNYEIARYALSQGAQVTLIANRIDSSLQEMGATWIPIPTRFERVKLLKVKEFAHKSNRTIRALPQPYILHGAGYTLDCPHHVNNCQFVHGSWLKSPWHISRMKRGLWGAYQKLYTRRNTVDELRVFLQAQIVVACSHQVGEQLREIGVPAERIRVILSGVDLQEFHPGPADRRELGLPQDALLAIFVGDIRTPRKNLDTVLRALVDVPPMHLIVVGNTRHSPFPQLAERLGVSSRTHFLGFRSDVPQIMRACDLLVFPTRYEPFGLVLTEALASGLPVITAQTAGGAEVITPDCGWVLEDPNDVKGVAAAMNSLVDEPQRRLCMGRAARAVAEQLSWQKMAQAHYTLYESFVS